MVCASSVCFPRKPTTPPTHTKQSNPGKTTALRHHHQHCHHSILHAVSYLARDHSQHPCSPELYLGAGLALRTGEHHPQQPHVSKLPTIRAPPAPQGSDDEVVIIFALPRSLTYRHRAAVDCCIRTPVWCTGSCGWFGEYKGMTNNYTRTSTPRDPVVPQRHIWPGPAAGRPLQYLQYLSQQATSVQYRRWLQC